MRLRLEFSRSGSDGWRNIGEYATEYFGEDAYALQAARTGFEPYRCNGNDYITRVRDLDTNEILCQYFATRGSWVGHEENVEIVWGAARAASRPQSGRIRNMIKVGVRRVSGKLMLLVDAKDFHSQLDEIGCTHTGGKYNDRPSAANTVATSTFAMSTEVLLTRNYAEVEVPVRKTVDSAMVTTMEKMPVTGCFDLSGVWSNPPSFENLKKLCNSANDAARKILEHYQPIDISVEIHKKVVKN